MPCRRLKTFGNALGTDLAHNPAKARAFRNQVSFTQDPGDHAFNLRWQSEGARLGAAAFGKE
ncbi:hypothetical protein STA1M1_39580 [Sinisalibacter aestuarii]|uniref:Uncharacterized protein n=1 Tax=Sinisalibacter aestuarii TaxID=2949426 RepID=A0ABQ5LYN0_9RHOB|nr:hypothetical protein STA1M1_39580 [Sinisalibacter aestuarii]